MRSPRSNNTSSSSGAMVEKCSCGKELANKDTLRRHKQESCGENAVQNGPTFFCVVGSCGRFYKRKWSVKQHIKETHPEEDLEKAMEKVDVTYANGGLTST